MLIQVDGVAQDGKALFTSKSLNERPLNAVPYTRPYRLLLLSSRSRHHLAKCLARRHWPIVLRRSLQDARGCIELSFGEAQKRTQARTSIASLKRRDAIPRVLRCHHPKAPLAIAIPHIRSAYQMTMAKAAILVLAIMAEHYANKGSVDQDVHVSTKI